MREVTDLSQFLAENETYKTRAYEHALDLIYMFVAAMEDQGLKKTELAEKMDIPLSRLSKLFNTQPNMTLETIARFELALDVDIQFEMHRKYQGAEYVETVVRDIDFSKVFPCNQSKSTRRSNIVAAGRDSTHASNVKDIRKAERKKLVA